MRCWRGSNAMTMIWGIWQIIDLNWQNLMRVLQSDRQDKESRSIKNRLLEYGVTNLFDVRKHDSVIPLINALESRTLKVEMWRMLRFNRHFMKEHEKASNILWRNFMSTQQLHLEICRRIDWFLEGGQVWQSFNFYWLRLIKVIWRRLKELQIWWISRIPVKSLMMLFKGWTCRKETWKEGKSQACHQDNWWTFGNWRMVTRSGHILASFVIGEMKGQNYWKA